MGLNKVVSPIIHPMCVIDEYAMIDRSFTWFIPNMPPIIAFMAAIIVRMILADGVKINDININGASFCNVDKIKQLDHEIDDITEGYHIWNGANPNFNDKLIIRIKFISCWNGELNHIENLAINSNLDPRAWTKKYLIVASVSWNSWEEDISGIKHSRFSSMAIHMNNQLVLEIARSDLSTKVIIDNI